MADSLGVFDARTRFSELIDRAERGEEIVVTRRGRPVARIVPASGGVRSPEAVAEILEVARRLREGMAARGVKTTQAEIRAWRNEGRP